MNRLLAVIGLATGLWMAPAAWAAGPEFAAMEVQSYDPPKAASAFALPDLNGKTVRLEELQGKVVMLFFWATW